MHDLSRWNYYRYFKIIFPVFFFFQAYRFRNPLFNGGGGCSEIGLSFASRNQLPFYRKDRRTRVSVGNDILYCIFVSVR